MGLYNNVPTFTYISATGITVNYNNKVYTVQSFYTNKKYIYWDSDYKTILQASNTMPISSEKIHLVLINDNGIVTTVPSTSSNFEINYDGDSENAIKSRVYALYEKNKELGDKYVAIEQDVDVIKQIVGSGTGDTDLDDIIEKLSKFEQTAEKIEASVGEVKKEYDIDKEVRELRDNLSSAIIKLNSDLAITNDNLQDYYKDNKISNEEKTSIQTMLTQLESSKENLLSYVDIVKTMVELDDYTALDSSISGLNTAHTFLVDTINTVISDFNVVPSEITVLIDAVAKYTLKINEFKNTCDEIIHLGVAGVISEKLAQISIKSNEVKLSVNSIKSEIQSNKNTFEKDLSDVNDRLDSLGVVLDGTFENNILNEAERKLLNQNILDLKAQKSDVDIEYEKLFNSPYLNESLKLQYKSSYNTFIEKYNFLIGVINGILEKEDLINNTDRENVNTANNNLSNSIEEFINLSNAVMESITEAREKEINDSFNKEVEDLNNRVDNVISDMNNTLKDDIIDQAERKVLLDGLNDLEIQKNDVINQYENLLNNLNFTDTNLRKSLKTAYDTFLNKCNNLINSIEYLLEKEGLITDSDRLSYQTAYDEYKESSSLFANEFYKANDSITEKLLNDFKTDFNKEISDLSIAVSDLDESMNGVFKDGLLSEAEKIAINEQIKILEREKDDIDVNHNIVVKNTFLTSTLKNELTKSYTNYSSSYNNLINIINEILNSDGIISTSHKNNYENALVNYRGNLSNYSEKLRNSLDGITNNSVAEAKKELSDEINEVLGSLSDLESNMNESFRDGVLSDAEKVSIKQQLQSLQKEKEDIDNQYETLYNNTFLVDTSTNKPKSELKTAYDTFIFKYNLLVTAINTVVNKTTNITTTDRSNIQNTMSGYREASSNYTIKSMNALDSIANKRAESESSKIDEKYSEIILSEDGILNRVGSTETIVTSHTTQLGTVDSRINTAKNSAISIASDDATTKSNNALASAKTDATNKFNNALSDAKTYTDSQITTVNKTITDKVAEIKTTTDEISQRVTSTETTTSTLSTKVDNVQGGVNTANANISSLNTRMQSAESKLTKNGLTTIIENHYTTSSDVNGIVTSKNYATKGDVQNLNDVVYHNYAQKSEVTQTAEAIKYSFVQSGGYNKLRNSAFKFGTNHWSLLSWNNVGNTGGDKHIGVAYAGEDWALMNRNCIYACASNLRTNTGQVLGVGFDSAPIWGGVDWTFSCLLACHRANRVTIEIIEFDSAGNRIADQGWNYDNVGSGGHWRSNWTKVHQTFSLRGNGTVNFIVRVFMGAWNGEMNSAYMWMAEPMVTLGYHGDLMYTPNSDELYSGITEIDADGIKVKHSDYNGYTHMAPTGFWISKDGRNIFSVSSGGLYMEGNGLFTGKIETGETIKANGGIYTAQDIRGYDPTGVTGGLTLVTGTGHLAVRTENPSHNVYLQPAGGEVKVTAPSEPDNFKNLRAWNLLANNKVYANGVALTSNRDKKKNIEDYTESALHEICTTPIRKYHLNTDLDEELKRIGIVVQEAPLNAIDLEGDCVDLYQMVTMSWKAIQELKEENDILKLKIEELRGESIE